jgi:hypothetical protein
MFWFFFFFLCGMKWVKSSYITWLVGLRCVLRSQEGWQFEICLRERPFRGWLGTVHIAVLGEGGVPMRFMSCIGWGFGKISGGVVGSFLAILDLWWVMALKLSFGMTYGAGTKPLR